MKLKRALSFFGWCVLCLSVGGLGSLATKSSLSDWYIYLNKPDWTPPNWVFAPVWTFIYLLMGISIGLVWEKIKTHRNDSLLIVFLIQLILNGAWSWLFFTFKSPGAALIDIVLLWLAILATILKFKRESQWAAGLLLPYLAWVTFAAFLNGAIYRLN